MRHLSTSGGSFRPFIHLLPSAIVATVIVGSPGASTAQQGAPAGMQTWSDASGYSMQYPAGWQAQETEQGLVLVPPDAVRAERGQPLEMLLLGSDDAEGVSSPSEPAVGEYLMGQLGDGFKQVGETSAFRSGLGPGATWSYEGAFPGGPPIVGKVHVVLHQGTGFFLMELVAKEYAGKRSADVSRILESFSWTQPKGDPELHGSWYRSRTEGSSGFGGGVFANTYTVYTFQPDGTVLWRQTSRIDGTTSGVSAYSESGPNVWKGTFGTSEGTLTIRWEDGSVETFAYSVFLDHEGNPALALTAPGEKAVYYERTGGGR